MARPSYLKYGSASAMKKIKPTSMSPRVLKAGAVVGTIRGARGVGSWMNEPLYRYRENVNVGKYKISLPMRSVATRGQVIGAAVVGIAAGISYLLYRRMHNSKKIGDYKVVLNNNLRGASELHLSGPGVNIHKKMPTKEAVPLYASIKTVTDVKQIALA